MKAAGWSCLLPNWLRGACSTGNRARAPVVFLHGYMMGGGLWDPVVRRPEADLTAAGLGRLVAEFLDALDLRGGTRGSR